MGGYSSGKRGGRSTTDDMRPLDVRRLKREGLLTPGGSFGWNWTRNNETVARINIRVNSDSVYLSYQQSWRGGAWRYCGNTVLIDWTTCNYGGRRAWWRCPAAGCGRRVAVLYSGRGAYTCRHCLGLAYRCQRETQTDLAARRANKIRDRLGWDRGILNLPGGRPKGMHWKTYLRLVREQNEHSASAFIGLSKQLGMVESRLHKLPLTR